MLDAGCCFRGIEKTGMGSTALNFILTAMLALTIGVGPAFAAVEQCRFIQAKAEREACYERQEKELAAKRKPEPTSDASKLESLQEMRRDDDAVYKSLRSICRGC
jgi:hypothetical protein